MCLRRSQFFEFLCGFIKVKVFSWSVIEFVDYHVNFALLDTGQVFLFREALPYQTVGIFTESSLPEGIRMCEVYFGIQRVGDGLLVCERLAIIHR